MVRCIGYAMYRPHLRCLGWVWQKPQPPSWNQWTPTQVFSPYPSERGNAVHGLPWGTPELPKSWKELVEGHKNMMEPYQALPDKGLGLAKAINSTFLCAESIPIHGTVDYAIVVGDMWTGVEMKTGLWKYAPMWEHQLSRHLSLYARVLLTMVTPEAARADVPTFVLCCK
jgi:hypothetical protein